MIRLPTSVEPVKHDLADGRVGRRTARPTTEPLPGMTVNTPSGRPASSASSPSRMRGHRGELGRLEHDGVAGGERGREAPARDRHREVPRHDDADDAERLLERHVEAAGDRDLPAEEPLRRRGVVVEHVADVARLPPGVADGVARSCAPPAAASSSTCAVDRGRRSGAAAVPGRRARRGARSRSAACGARDRRVGLLDAEGRATVATTAPPSPGRSPT